MADRGSPLRTTLRIEAGPVVGTTRSTYLEVRQAVGRGGRPQIVMSRIVETTRGEGRCAAVFSLDRSEALELVDHLRDLTGIPRRR